MNSLSLRKAIEWAVYISVVWTAASMLLAMGLVVYFAVHYSEQMPLLPFALP